MSEVKVTEELKYFIEEVVDEITENQQLKPNVIKEEPLSLWAAIAKVQEAERKKENK